MIKKNRRFFLVLAIIISVAPTFVFAHGLGQTLTKIVGEYEVDIDYDTFTLVAEEATRFNFNLFKKGDRTEPVEFTDIWVRIAPKDGFGIAFAGPLAKPDFGAIGMTYTFPKSGEYELTVRFHKSGETIVEEISFPLIVEANASEAVQSPWRSAVFLGIIGFVLGVFITWFVKKKKSI